MNSNLLKTLLLASSLIWTGSALAAKPVGITPDMMDAKVMHGGKNMHGGKKVCMAVKKKYAWR